MKFIIKEKSYVIFLIWMILVSGFPFIFAYLFNYPPLLPMMLAVFMLCCISLKRKFIINKFRYHNFIMIMFVTFYFYILYHLNIQYVSNLVQIVIIGLIFTIIANTISYETFAKQYIKFMSYIVIVGVLGWLIVFIFNAPPITHYIAHDGRNVALYPLTACNTYVPEVSHPIIRYSAVFDEPGTLAFFSMIALLLNKICYDNKKVEKILFLGPILTFSIAHIITVILYSLLFYVKKMSSLLLIITLFVSTSLAVVSLKDSEYGRLYTLVFARFETDKDGQMKGNNRAPIMENAKKYFEETPLLGSGIKIDEKEYVASNPYTNFAYYGIIGFFLIHIFLIYTFFKSLKVKNKSVKWMNINSLIILFVNFQIRPFNTNVFYFTSVFLLLIMMNENVRKRNSENHTCLC